jgi:hypothetical protein
MDRTFDDEAFQQEEVLALVAHSSPSVGDASPSRRDRRRCAKGIGNLSR